MVMVIECVAEAEATSPLAVIKKYYHQIKKRETDREKKRNLKTLVEHGGRQVESTYSFIRSYEGFVLFVPLPPFSSTFFPFHSLPSASAF